MNKNVTELLARYAIRIADTADELPDCVIDRKDKSSLRSVIGEWSSPENAKPSLRDIARILPGYENRPVSEARAVALMQDTVHSMRHVMLAEAVASMRNAVVRIQKFRRSSGFPEELSSRLVTAEQQVEKAADAALRHMIGLKQWSGSHAVAEDVLPYLGQAGSILRTASAELLETEWSETANALLSDVMEAAALIDMQD